jgi:hypothetical protein
MAGEVQVIGGDVWMDGVLVARLTTRSHVSDCFLEFLQEAELPPNENDPMSLVTASDGAPSPLADALIAAARGGLLRLDDVLAVIWKEQKNG